MTSEYDLLANRDMQRRRHVTDPSQAGRSVLRRLVALDPLFGYTEGIG